MLVQYRLIRGHVNAISKSTLSHKRTEMQTVIMKTKLVLYYFQHFYYISFFLYLICPSSQSFSFTGMMKNNFQKGPEKCERKRVKRPEGVLLQLLVQSPLQFAHLEFNKSCNFSRLQQTHKPNQSNTAFCALWRCLPYAIFNYGHIVTAWYCPKNGEDQHTATSSYLTEKGILIKMLILF